MKWFLPLLTAFTSISLVIVAKCDIGIVRVTSLSWIPAVGVTLPFSVDSLSLFFGIVAALIGIIISIFSFQTLSNIAGFNRFSTYLFCFFLAALGTIFAANFICLFIFWELTSLFSFLLIGFHNQDAEARKSAFISLITTSTAGTVLFVGLLAISNLTKASTFQELEVLAPAFPNSPEFIVAAICVLVGILAKSAAFPFHYWLPRASTAPTPATAYLHAATMVQLGIYLLMRLNFLFRSPVLIGLIFLCGILTMLAGSVSAVFEKNVKRALAYATVFQMGQFFAEFSAEQLGLGHLDRFHLLSHAFYKSTLFLLAGILLQVSHQYKISKLSRIGKKMPLATAGFVIGLAAMCSLPGTAAFFTKNQVLRALTLGGKHHPVFAVTLFFATIVSSVGLATFAWRLIHQIFWGPEIEDGVQIPSIKLQLTAACLALPVLIFGAFPQLISPAFRLFFSDAIQKNFEAPFQIDQYWSMTTLIQVALFALGGIIFYLQARYQPEIKGNPNASIAGKIERLIRSFGHTIHRRLRVSTPTAYFPILAGSLITLIATLLVANWDIWRALKFEGGFSAIQLFLAIGILTFSAIVLRTKSGFTKIIALSGMGVFVVGYFVFYKAPDLALTQLTVELFFLLIFLLCLAVHPRLLKSENGSTTRTRFSATLSIIFGVSIGVVVLVISAFPNPTSRLGAFYLENCYRLTGGKNVVDAIVNDFRGFDTLGEISVLAIATLGTLSLIQARRQTRNVKMPQLSPFFGGFARYIVICLNVMALYFLLEGHSRPGGGFVAGMIIGLSLALLYLADPNRTKKIIHLIKPSRLVASGLFLICSIGFLPTILKRSFLWHASLRIPINGAFLSIGTPLLFDLGVASVVMGTIVSLSLRFSKLSVKGNGSV